MIMGRREFIKMSAAAGAAAAVSCSDSKFEIPAPEKSAVLKLSCQEGVAPGETLTEKLDFIEANGFTGIEPGGRGLPDRVAEFQKELKNRNVKISAICAGFKGVPLSQKPEVRQEAINSIKEILIAAGELGAVGMIVVPAFNNQTTLHHKESRELLLEILPELAEHAQKAKTRVILEPLNRKEAYFLRQVADAAAICRDANHPGVCCMGDFWHMTWEETSDMGAFISGGDLLHHVHIASRKRRKMPGEDEGDNYVEGLRGLKIIGYQDYISLECGSVGDKKETIPAAAKLIQEQWEMA